MPKFQINRFTYYRQFDRVVVEADDVWDAYRLAKKEEDPEWN